MTNEITTKPNSTALAKPVEFFDASNLSGFSLGELSPSNLILIQGSNDLKDKAGAKDGDFVIDNAVTEQPLEFILIRTDKIYDEYEFTELDKNGKIPKNTKYLRSHKPSEIEHLPGLLEHSNKIYMTDDKRLFQCKKVFLVSIKGIPVRIVFKSTSKHWNATDIFKKVITACKQHNLTHSMQAVFALTSIKRKNEKANSTYYVFDCNYVREATEKEMMDAAPFVDMNLVDVKHEEEIDEGAPF